MAAATPSTRPDRPAPTGRRRCRPRPTRRRCRSGVRSGLAIRPAAEVPLGHVPGKPACLGLPPAVGELLIVKVVVRRAELAIRPLERPGPHRPRRQSSSSRAHRSGGQCRSASIPIEGRASSVSRAIRRHSVGCSPRRTRARQRRPPPHPSGRSSPSPDAGRATSPGPAVRTPRSRGHMCRPEPGT